MPVLFTPSGAQAWQWVLNGITRGMTATDALLEFRAGGGHLRTTEWYGLYKGAQDTAFRAEIDARMPDYFYPSREGMNITNWKYDGNFVWHPKIVAYDSDGSYLGEFWRSIVSDKNLTIAGWNQALAEQVARDSSYNAFVAYDILESSYEVVEH